MVNTVQANRKRALVDYSVRDLVYSSSKDISLPNGRARKLTPKFLGPCAIAKVLKEGATYRLDLSEELLKCGINRSFRAPLPKQHLPNDDRRFPCSLPSRFPGFSEISDELIADAIISPWEGNMERMALGRHHHESTTETRFTGRRETEHELRTGKFLI